MVWGQQRSALADHNADFRKQVLVSSPSVGWPLEWLQSKVAVTCPSRLDAESGASFSPDGFQVSGRCHDVKGQLTLLRYADKDRKCLVLLRKAASVGRPKNLLEAAKILRGACAEERSAQKDRTRS